MNSQKDKTDGTGNSVAAAMKIAIAVAFFFLIPVAVARNTFGLADKLSGLPGISKRGGVASGVAAAVIVFGGAGVVAGGGIIAAGGDIPTIGHGDHTQPVDPATITPRGTLESTSTPTPEPTPTATSTLEPTTALQTPDPDPLTRFENNYRARISYTLENESLTGVPILATEYRENDQGQTVLWLVFWECDEGIAEADQWVTIANYLASTAGRHEGEMPARVRVYAVTNIVSFEDTTTYINTSDARAVYNREIDLNTYRDTWSDRAQIPSQAMNETAYQMVVSESGQERANEAFYDDHEGIQDCPGPAEVGTGSDAYDGE